MKWLFLSIGLLSAVATCAQTSTASPNQPATYRYCALVVEDRAITDAKGLYLDWGQSVPGAAVDVEMTELLKNIRVNGSVVGVLNYLGQHGWELVSVVPLQTKARLPSAPYDHDVPIELETHYFFRRRTP